MANGFLTSSPSARHGDNWGDMVVNYSVGGKFVAPGSGPLTLQEIGGWFSVDSSTTTAFRLAVFTHDAANNCPETMVANSESAELTHNTTSFVKKSHTYSGTKPVVTGGSTYWIVGLYADSNANLDDFVAGGTTTAATGGAYPTWATGATWESGSDGAQDFSYYAVYAPPSAAVTGTATASITETDIVNGSKTIIITLTGDTFIPS